LQAAITHLEGLKAAHEVKDTGEKKGGKTLTE